MGKAKKTMICLTLVAAIGVGSVFGWRQLRQGSGEPVKVYAFDLIGMTEYWGDVKESYGPVSTDKIQTIYLSDTQTVSEILVQEGQEVKKGDLLMTFDTTLSQLELERKKVELQKLELELDEAKVELQRINWLVPMGVPPTQAPTEPTFPDLGEPLLGEYRLFTQDHDGSSPEMAVICWIPQGKVLSAEFFQELRHSLLYGQPEPSRPTLPSEPQLMEQIVRELTGQEKLVFYTDFLPEPTFGVEPGILFPEEEEPTQPAAEDTQPTGEDTQSATEETKPEGEKTQPIPEETQVTTRKPIEPNATVLCETAVNVRTGPGLEYPAVSTLPNGHRIYIFEWVEVEGVLWGRIGEEQWVCMTYVLMDGAAPPETTAPIQESTEPAAETTVPTEEPTESAGEPTVPTEEPTEPAEETTAPTQEPTEEPTEESTEEPIEDIEDPSLQWEWTGPTKEPSEPTEPPESGEFYVVFKTTQGNCLLTENLQWVGVHIRSDDSFTFFDARNLPDYSIPEPSEEEEETLPAVDYIGSGMTSAEIAQQREEQTRKIRDLELQLKLAQSDLKIMERELSDGNIYSEQDGKVVSLLTEDEAKLNSQPLMKVSGGGGYYIEATISELERHTVKIGMEVTVNDWEGGGTYTGSVVSVGDIPSSSSFYNGMSNPNASNYPLRVFVDESADLRAGGYVNVQYASDSQGGIYLRNPFLRTVQGRSFVYVLGPEGTLEERTVTVGKTMGGSYTQILDGLTAEDKIAFPYGKTVVPGAPAVEGDLSDLYG